MIISHRTARRLGGLAAAITLGALASRSRPCTAPARHVLGVDEKWCRAVATTYQKETGVQVDMTRMSAGEVYARVRAEKDNPHGDVRFGGTGDPHLQAADELSPYLYVSPTPPKLRDGRSARHSARTTHVGLTSTCGFGYNTKDIDEAQLDPLAVRPTYRAFKGEVHMADPIRPVWPGRCLEPSPADGPGQSPIISRR